MGPCGDVLFEMGATRHIPDDVIEAIVRGDAVPPAYESVSAFAHQLRRLGGAPPPVPSPELADMFAGRLGAERAPGHVVDLVGGRPGRKRRPGIERVASLGLAAKLGLGGAIAAAGVVGAGVAGMLPASANEAVRGAVEVVTPVDFDNHEADKPNFGHRVSADARGGSDGDDGVDGRQISDEAPGAAHRNGGAGRARAHQTPAADHAPDQDTPGAPSPDDGRPDDTRPPADAGVDRVPGPSGASGRPATVPSTVPPPSHTRWPAGG